MSSKHRVSIASVSLPAILKGRPVSQHMVIEYNFMLK